MRGEFIFSFHCVLVSLCSGSLAAYLWGMVGDVKIGAFVVLPKLHCILGRQTLLFVPFPSLCRVPDTTFDALKCPI